jgi:hypothetical protein
MLVLSPITLPLVSSVSQNVALQYIGDKFGVKPYVILVIGAGLTYLALTGKADILFRSLFGKLGK